MYPIIVAKQMIILFLIVLIGTFLRKKELVTDEHSKFMSSMVINVFNPALIFTSAVSQKCEDTTMVYKTFIFALLSYLLLIVTGKIYQKFFAKEHLERNIYQMLFVFSNVGFIGIPVINAMFGSYALVYVAIFIMEYNVLLYTYGMSLLSTEPKRQTFYAKIKPLINIGMFSCIFAILFFTLNIPVPEIIKTPLTYLGNCATPVSLLIIGFSIGSQEKISRLFTGIKYYMFCFLKLVVTSVIGILIFKHMPLVPELIRTLCVVLMAMPCGSMTLMIVQKAGIDDKDCCTGILLSTILSVATLPLVVLLYNIIP